MALCAVAAANVGAAASNPSLLPADKGGGGQKTGGRDDWRQEGINFSKDPASNPSPLPTDNKGGGQKTGGRDDWRQGGIIFLKPAPASNPSPLPAD